jgi:hypothetical protein
MAVMTQLRETCLDIQQMSFWKGLQIQTEHLPIVDVSGARERWIDKYVSNMPTVPTWMLHVAWPDFHSGPVKFPIRWYNTNALPVDGCHTQLISSHKITISINAKHSDQFEFIEFTKQIPIHASAQFHHGFHIPLAHWGDGRFGLQSKFPLPRRLFGVNDLFLHFEFAEPYAQTDGRMADPIGLQMTSLDTQDARCHTNLIVIPVYAGHDKDHENTAFLCISDGVIQARGKIDTLQWILSQHMKLHSHIIDKYAIVWQRRYRKRCMAREVYAHTNLPRDMCWIAGAYASGGHVEPSALDNDHDASF